jgi:hypothetical protein
MSSPVDKRNSEAELTEIENGVKGPYKYENKDRYGV